MTNHCIFWSTPDGLENTPPVLTKLRRIGTKVSTRADRRGEESGSHEAVKSTARAFTCLKTIHSHPAHSRARKNNTAIAGAHLPR